jgi:hypothetical protein
VSVSSQRSARFNPPTCYSSRSNRNEVFTFLCQWIFSFLTNCYPSVRATNVYEEKSLGIYKDDISIDEEEIFSLSGNRMSIWGNYLAMHARRQLAFGTRPSHGHDHKVHPRRLDMWWLGLALFLVCIIEVCCSPSFSSLRLTITFSVTSSITKTTQHGLIFSTFVNPDLLRLFHVNDSL